FSTSTSGDLAYISNAQAQQSRFVWVDRSGKDVGGLGMPASFQDFALSPDAARVAVAISGIDGRGDIWVIDAKRGTASRLTFDPVDHFYPVWSPDGTHVAYNSTINK